MYTGILLLMSTCICFLLIRVLLLDYQALVPWIVQQLKKPELEGLLRDRALTPGKFRLLQKISMAGLILWPFIAFFFYRKKQLFIGWISRFLQILCGKLSACAALFRLHSKWEKTSFLLVLFLICGRSLLYILNRDLQYDEMWSYNYYSASPFYFPVFMYSNYPLYEISTHFFSWLPFPIKINIRLPALFAGLMACSLFYFYLYSFVRNQIPALTGMVLLAFLPPVTSYMFLGRGVIFELFFAILSLFSLLRWLESPKRLDHLLVFVIANIGGVYSMPSHIYFWICLDILAVLALTGKTYAYRRLWIANLAIGTGVLIAYLPILLGSGVSFLLNMFKLTLPLKRVWVNLPAYLGNLSYYFTGFVPGLTVVLILCIVMSRMNKVFGPYQKIIWFCCLLCVLPVFTNLFQRFITPFRTLTFIALVLPLWSVILFQVSSPYLKRNMQFAMIILLMLICAAISDQNRIMNWSRERDKQVRLLSAALLNRGVITCYDNSTASSFNYYYPGLEFYYRQAGKSIRLTLGNQRSLRFKLFSPSDHYDCLISDRDSIPPGLTGNYELFLQEPKENFDVYFLQKTN